MKIILTDWLRKSYGLRWYWNMQQIKKWIGWK